MLRNALFDHERPARSDGTFETVRVDEVLGQLTEKLIIATSEHSEKGRIYETDARLSVHQKNPVGSVL